MRQKLRFVLLGVLVVSVAAAACGGGDEFDDTEDAGGGGTAGASGAGATGGSSGGSGGSAGGGAGGAAGADAATDASVGGAAGAAGADAGPDVTCVDGDGDGVDTCSGDCDDSDPTSFPNNAETCGDGADNDCANGADDGCGGIGTFVSVLTGDDTWAGTKDKPVKTIAKGIANAQLILAAKPTVDVFVAEGHYPEKVTLAEGVGLLGGFSCTQQPCSWQRDSAQYEAEILNQDFQGVLANATITRKTRLDGFKITGKSGDTSGQQVGSACLTLLGGTPVVANNTLDAGDATAGAWPAGRSVGLAVLGPSNALKGALIQANEIAAGNAVEASIGLLFDPASKPGFAYAEVKGNDISAGKGKSAAGIVAWNTGTGTLIQNNDVFGGEALLNGAWGIQLGGRAAVDGNRVNAGSTPVKCVTTTDFCGGIVSASSTSIITNNVVFGAGSAPRSAAVLLAEFETPAGAVTLSSNYLHGSGSSSTGSVSTAVALQHGLCCGAVAIVGRIANNVLVGGSASARFAIYEVKVANKAAHPELLLNNDFFIANPTTADGYYQYWDGVSLLKKETTLAGVNGLSAQLGLVADNVDGDPKVDATFHLQSGSPCIDKGTATDAPALDFEGDARPKGAAHDIGPDES